MRKSLTLLPLRSFVAKIHLHKFVKFRAVRVQCLFQPETPLVSANPDIS